MTISAVGAVILGFVGEAAALAFLYSIAEALEDKAMDRAQGGLRALLSWYRRPRRCCATAQRPRSKRRTSRLAS